MKIVKRKTGTKRVRITTKQRAARKINIEKARKMKKNMGLGRNIKVTSGGKAKIGEKAIAPSGKYVHSRRTSPTKYSAFKTVSRGENKLRLGKNKRTGKWELHDVLTPIFNSNVVLGIKKKRKR